MPTLRRLELVNNKTIQNKRLCWNQDVANQDTSPGKHVGGRDLTLHLLKWQNSQCQE